MCEWGHIVRPPPPKKKKKKKKKSPPNFQSPKGPQITNSNPSSSLLYMSTPLGQGVCKGFVIWPVPLLVSVSGMPLHLEMLKKKSKLSKAWISVIEMLPILFCFHFDQSWSTSILKYYVIQNLIAQSHQHWPLLWRVDFEVDAC